MTERLNNIFDRARIWFAPVPFLSMTKKQVLLNVLNGSIGKPGLLLNIWLQEIRDSDYYLEGIRAESPLYEKCLSATHPQLLATGRAARLLKKVKPMSDVLSCRQLVHG